MFFNEGSDTVLHRGEHFHPTLTRNFDVSEYSSRRRQLWAVLLKKVWDIDALKCPKCGGQMKVISAIEQPYVIRRILKHLDLWEDPRPQPRPLELVCEPCADYVPFDSIMIRSALLSSVFLIILFAISCRENLLNTALDPSSTYQMTV